MGQSIFFSNNSKWNPNLFTHVDYQSFTLRIATPQIIGGPVITFKDSISDVTIAQINTTVGVGAQYFLNPLLATTARLEITAYGLNNGKPFLRPSIIIGVKPFYSISSCKTAREKQDFFYQGRLEVDGLIWLQPKNSNLKNAKNYYYAMAKAKYFFNKYVGAGGYLDLNFIGTEFELGTKLYVETQIKLINRLYLSPSIVAEYLNVKDVRTAKTLSANLGLSYFVNKNVAWNLNFISVPIYDSNTTKPSILFLDNTFSYYLK